MSKAILVLDEINLLLNSEEPKNTKLYGNLFEVLSNITETKAISMEEIINVYHLNKIGQAALTYNKKSLLDNVKGEWYVESDSSEDINQKARCGLCNTPNKYIFYIRNRHNATRLNVGSYCMTKFPGIEGYTEYKYHLNKTIKNQKVAARRMEFYDKFPNVVDILDSASFYFDNLPILLPYNLYIQMEGTVRNLRIIYSQYINYGKNPLSDDKNPFKIFSEYVDKYHRLKIQSEKFISLNRNKRLVCRKSEMEWMLHNKQRVLLEEISRNNGIYTKQTLSEISSNNFIYQNFKLFCKHNASHEVF